MDRKLARIPIVANLRANLGANLSASIEPSWDVTSLRYVNGLFTPCDAIGKRKKSSSPDLFGIQEKYFAFVQYLSA